MKGPNRVDVRAYDVGFGDAILVSFGYPSGRDRHLLIDFGTNKAGADGPNLKEVGEAIRADIVKGPGDKLDALVLTHRHRDHLAGFAPMNAGDLIKGLAPDAVLRPWTEQTDHPGAGPAHLALLKALDRAHQLAAPLEHFSLKGLTVAERDLLSIAALQYRNDDAIKQLDELAGDHGHYLRYGNPVDLADILPGVRITVLGPPDPALYPPIRKQADSSPEFWLQFGIDEIAALAQASARDPLARRHVVGGAAADNAGRLLGPGPIEWLMDHLDEHQPRSSLRLIHTLDAVMNNTSLILLIEAAGRSMLFPGDAQIESWQYVLRDAPDAAANRDRLKAIDLYKVGHHGSRNATPRLSLRPLWTTLPACLMSTAPGMYDKENAVPASALVAELGGALHSTDTLVLPPHGTDRPVVQLSADHTHPFARVR